MLSLAVTTHLKRRTLRQRLRLCLNEKIIKDSFCSHYGEINIYRIYHFSKKPFFTPEVRVEKVPFAFLTPLSYSEESSIILATSSNKSKLFALLPV